MPKGQFTHDLFEQLSEFGINTAKKTVKQIKKTFNLLDILKLQQKYDNEDNEKQKKLQEKLAAKSTPLDTTKLEERYRSNEQAVLERLRSQFFNRVREEEKKVIQEKKQLEIQRKQIETKQEEERKIKQRQLENQQPAEIPRGKIRRSIFSPKKVAQKQHQEFKPSSGKN